jgi:hypothetical protein
MACTCLILSADDFGTVPPNTLRRSADAAMERSCCKETGTWQWAGYKLQAPGVREAEAAHCRNVEMEASVVVGGGSDVEPIGCNMWRPRSLRYWVAVYQGFGSQWDQGCLVEIKTTVWDFAGRNAACLM